MAAVVRKWKRWLACACSHGPFICPKARTALLKFKANYRPDHTMHLGDFCDVTALRGGANGTKDEAADIEDDLKAGLTFLVELEPQWIFMGNHEARLECFLEHQNALKAFVAGRIIGDIHFVRDQLKAELIPYHIDHGWRQLGNFNFGHGYMYCEAAIRDHAEYVGNCVFGHLHRPGEERGRRRGGATGYCIGLMADIAQLKYATTRKATSKWQNAFAYGEYCDTATTINLCRRAENGDWRLP